MGVHYLLYFSLLLSMCFQTNAAAKCRPQDKEALLNFKNTLVSDPSAESDCVRNDWDEAVDCCSWEGIACDDSTGSVIYLRIGYSCVKGTSSSFSSNTSLFDLSDLRTLDFGRFNLQHSSIPIAIAKLTQLRTLLLNQANLRGPIPDALGNLAKLTDLDLSSNTFSGSIPLSLSNLGNLQLLDLSKCGLNGTIPNVLANLPHLQTLKLSENSLTGTIPGAFFSHPRLSELRLSSNHLRGSFSATLVGSSNLNQLVLSGNRLNGMIPSWLFAIPFLQTLDLSDNRLGSLQPFPKPAITSLDSLDLSFNKISGPWPSSFENLANLTSLNLEANQLTGDVEWNSFKNMANLLYLTLSLNIGLDLKNTKGPAVILPFFRYLDVRSCSLTKFPSFLSKFSEFQYLDVSDNRIGGSIFTEGGWGQLGVFYGSHNQITAFEFPKERIYWFDFRYNLLAGALPKPPSSLEFISLAHNQFVGTIPKEFCNLTKIRTLDLGFNNLEGVLPSCLLNVSGEMISLGLQSNRFSGVIPDTFGHFSDSSSNNLRFIMLSNNNFQGPLPKSLSVCGNLKVLSVGNNQITDAFPSWLGEISTLQILILSSNRFSGSIGAPAASNQFKNLQILDVSSNNLTGSLPTGILQNLEYMINIPAARRPYVGDDGYIWNDNFYRFSILINITVKGVKLKDYDVLKNMTVLDFSNNQFSGEIPSVLGNLKALKVLTLTKNNLSGGIPETIGNIKDLQSLDLSRNKLGGRIPQSLKNLENLEYLNLTYNNLQGPIPTGKFSSASYIGNPALCGSPLVKSC